MDQVRKIDIFAQEAAHRLPGFLYSFNIADLARRNSHLGHLIGDSDIEAFDRLLSAMAPAASLAARTHGDRWHMLTRKDEKDRVQSILERFTRTEPFVAGWQVRGEKNGEFKTRKETVPAMITRAVRCLYAPVTTPAELKSALERLGKNDYSLPVNKPLALSAIEAMKRQPWRCVSRYPAQDPCCPFCGGRDFEWSDGDGSVYSGDGACKGCGATISVSDISQSSGR